MKKLIILSALLFPIIAFSQFSVGYYQSSIPYLGFNYEIKDRIKPELRIGTDMFFDDIGHYERLQA